MKSDFTSNTNGSQQEASTPPRAEIADLQRYLRFLSYRYPEIPAVPIDGIFDTATGSALSAFQQLVGLPVTGSADRTTWEALYRLYLDEMFGASAPVPLPVFTHFPPDLTLKPNDTGFPVSAVQYLLTELNTLYDFPSAVLISGSYDYATAQAVQEFQRASLLPITGEVDKRTWNYLVGAASAEDSMREQT